MFFRRYKSAVSKIILSVMIFASLAPTVSHALALFTGNQSFTQKICISNGTDKQNSVVVIQVKTTMGQKLATEISLKPTFTNQTAPASIEKHFEHCPFCLHYMAALPAIDNATFLADDGKFYLQVHYLAPILTALHQSNHPTRAPPL